MENAKLTRSFGCAYLLSTTIANGISAFGHCDGSFQKIIFVRSSFFRANVRPAKKKIIVNCAEPLKIDPNLASRGLFPDVDTDRKS